jgi:hypothetical protein
MSSNQKHSSLGWTLAISLGIACSAGVVHAGSIGDPDYTAGETLTAAKMQNIKNAVNDNDTRITTNTNDITSLTGTVTTNTANITSLTTTVGGHTTSINALATDVANLQTGSGSCSGNNASDVMVRVGSICVDKYEASLWTNQTSPGTSAAAGDCLADGSNCTYVAQSRAGVTPTSSISWMQATQACANAGKRLLRPAEWFMAAAGTDPTNCNINGASAAVANTGAYATCLSRHNVADMSGNVAEYIDYAQVDNITPSANGIPYASYSGGKYDSVGATLIDRYYANFLLTATHATVGFRCTR